VADSVIYDRNKAAQYIALARSNPGVAGGTIQDLADQLEAAGGEVEAHVRLRDERLEFAIRDHDNLLTTTAERDSLRAEVERLTHGLTLMTKERDAKVESMVELCGDVDRAKGYGNDMASTIERINAERDSLRQQLEAAQRTQTVHLAQLDGAQAILTETKRDSRARLSGYEVDLTAAQQKITDLTADLSLADKTAASLSTDLLALQGQRDDCHRQLLASQTANAAAQQEIMALNNANRSLVPDAMLVASDIECTRVERDAALADLAAALADLAAAQRERDGYVAQLLIEGEQTNEMCDEAIDQTSDLAVAQRRIAELEAENGRLVGCLSESNNEAEMQQRISDLESALRVFYPVYRAVTEVNPFTTGLIGRNRIMTAIDTARAALTPEILAALAEMGLEVE
jgi:chromosome segregation ATPase